MKSRKHARLTLVRHGESDWNVAHLVQGQSDQSRLTPRGREQARAVASTLIERQFDHLVSSDLARARQTASLIAAALKIHTVVEDASLRERSFGTLEGGPSQRLTQEVTGVVEGALADPDARPEGGESFRDVVCRATGALERWDGLWPLCSVLVVTHGVMIRAILACRAGASIESMPWETVENCSVWET